MATLLAVPVTDATTHLLSSSRESTKRKTPETVMSTMSKQPVQARNPNGQETALGSSPISTDMHDQVIDNNTNGLTSNLSSFRIPKIKKVSSPTSSTTTTESVVTTSGQSSSQQTNDDAQNRLGKRKFSLSQYKEHKRLKSNEPNDFSLGDVDMRIQNKPPSPPVMNNGQTIVSKTSSNLSPKPVEMNQIAAKKSNLSEPGVKKPLKKKLIWADEKQQALVQTSFFEIDETERANMHRFVHDCTNSVSIAKLEQLLERDLRQHPNDRPTLPPLPPLIRIQLPSTIPKPTVNSHQRIVQGEREQTVLQALFIRSLLPENPREPDGDATDTSTIETKLIPLEHDSVAHTSNEDSSTVNNANEKPNNVSEIPSSSSSLSSSLTVPSVTITPTIATATPTTTTTSSTTFYPEVAQILAAAREKATSATITNQTPTIVPPVINPPLTLPTINNPAIPFAITPNILSILFNGAQNSAVPPPPVNPLANLLSNIPFPLNLNPPQTNPSVNPLLTNPFSLVLPTNNPQQPSPLNFNPLGTTSTSTPTNTITTTNTNSTPGTNGSPTYFDNSRNQKPFRYNHHNNNQKPFSNQRGHHYRQGSNHNNRHKPYHHNRNGFS